jgi:Kef-type K+ transport system membrane component KefB
MSMTCLAWSPAALSWSNSVGVGSVRTKSSTTTFVRILGDAGAISSR